MRAAQCAAARGSYRGLVNLTGVTGLSLAHLPYGAALLLFDAAAAQRAQRRTTPAHPVPRAAQPATSAAFARRGVRVSPARAALGASDARMFR